LSVFGMSAYASRLWLSLQVGLALGIAVRAKPMLKQLCVRGPRDVALISCLRLCEKKKARVRGQARWSLTIIALSNPILNTPPLGKV
jgi:hypothetical protein